METPENLTYIAMSLVFLLLGVVLIASILMSTFNPYEQIAIANAEKLANAMNQLCTQNIKTPVHITFDLPQNTPVLSTFFTILPTWIMRAGGDPSFVIYYESFPPGEAIGWETYQKLDNRLYLILPETDNGKEWGIERAEEYVKAERDRFLKNNLGQGMEATVVANLVLNSRYSGMLLENIDVEKRSGRTAAGEKTKESTQLEREAAKALPGFGEWQYPEDAAQKDFFRFDNYAGLSTLEKTLIKYESCGPRSLCMKTKRGVYSFPLNQCKGKIKTVQLVYDARDRKGAWLTIAAIFSGGSYKVGASGSTVIRTIKEVTIDGVTAPRYVWLGKEAASGTSIFSLALKKLGPKALTGLIKHPFTIGPVLVGTAYELIGGFIVDFVAIKDSNLVLTSPCKIENAEIVMDSCNEPEVPGTSDYNPCSYYMKYPMFAFNEKTEKLDIARDDENQIIYHYECADKLEKKSGTNSDEKSMDVVDKDVKIKKEKLAFAVEENTGGDCIQVKVFEQPKGFCWTPDPSTTSYLGEDFFTNLDTKAAVAALGFMPVRESIEFVDTTSHIILRSTRNLDLEDFTSTWERRLAWGWPGLEGPIEALTGGFGNR